MQQNNQHSESTFGIGIIFFKAINFPQKNQENILFFIKKDKGVHRYFTKTSSKRPEFFSYSTKFTQYRIQDFLN